MIKQLSVSCLIDCLHPKSSKQSRKLGKINRSSSRFESFQTNSSRPPPLNGLTWQGGPEKSWTKQIHSQSSLTLQLNSDLCIHSTDCWSWYKVCQSITNTENSDRTSWFASERKWKCLGSHDPSITCVHFAATGSVSNLVSRVLSLPWSRELGTRLRVYIAWIYCVTFSSSQPEVKSLSSRGLFVAQINRTRG